MSNKQHKIEDLLGKRVLEGTGLRNTVVKELIVLEISASKRFARILRPGSDLPEWVEAANIAIVEVLENTTKWNAEKDLFPNRPFPPEARLIRGDYGKTKQPKARNLTPLDLTPFDEDQNNE